MNTQLIEKVHSDQMKKIPDIRIGDTVKLHIRISEGDKSRIQIFEGIILSMKGTGLDATLTVRKVSSGVGVEKIFPLHAPTLEKIEVVKRGKVRRSKLFYMRKRVGRRAMKIRGSQMMAAEEVVEDGAEVPMDTKKESEESSIKEDNADKSSDDSVSEEKKPDTEK